MRLSIKTKPIKRKTFSVSAIKKTKLKINRLNEKYTPEALHKLRVEHRATRQEFIREGKIKIVIKELKTKKINTLNEFVDGLIQAGYKDPTSIGFGLRTVGYKKIGEIVYGLQHAGLGSPEGIGKGLVSAGFYNMDYIINGLWNVGLASMENYEKALRAAGFDISKLKSMGYLRTIPPAKHPTPSPPVMYGGAYYGGNLD